MKKPLKQPLKKMAQKKNEHSKLLNSRHMNLTTIMTHRSHTDLIAESDVRTRNSHQNSCSQCNRAGLINTEIEGGYFGVFFSEIGGGRSLFLGGSPSRRRDAPDRMRPLPFHHQRSPSSSLVNIPQDTTIPESETHRPWDSHRPRNRVVSIPEISGPADTRGTWTSGIPPTGRLIPRSSDSMDEPWESVTAQHPESR